ncbi:6-hydroxymethylpterin diphosphokinase MptE-like protein [Fundidesulfovibrio soli]|uniref:6-hydroxymethylpterin diphosphokinase MptE-like protein n=1 Tax=Fundidesulfovibrio soli TaxID=2922716 RepID=UPI001FB02FAB|nr:6-hydroxymethylpterin diphosphokinase MptE-like protein [Fundidesulfovibrio soli]
MFLTQQGGYHPRPGDRSLVVFLGTAPDKAVPRERRLWFPSANEAAFEAVRGLDPGLLRHGVTLVVGAEAYDRHPAWVDAVQKNLAWRYLKYVYLPQTSPSVPDELGVRAREDAPALLYREIALARNHPLHLRWPLCRALEGKGGAPLAWLFPSPSLPLVLPALEELKRTCLIGCISLSLGFCLENGVEPDFVLQLDTDFRYPHLLRPGRKLKNTWLVSLSGANISDSAGDYAGVFFMEAFNTTLLPDPYRLRESWTGCAIACLGLAECLGAPDVFLAGVDHSWPGEASAELYYTPGAKEQTPSQDDHPEAPLVCSHRLDADLLETNAVFPMADVNGRKVWTRFNYFGIAAELEDVARQIGRERGMRFHRLSDTGILDAAVFLPGGLQALAALPDLDREALRERIASAARAVPPVRAAELAQALGERLRDVETAASLAREAEERGQPVPELAGLAQSLRRTGELDRYFHLETESAMLAGLADTLRAWAEALRRALGVALAHARIQAGEPLPVLGLPGDAEACAQALAALYPTGRFAPVAAQVPFKGPSDSGIHGLYGLLEGAGVVVVSEALEREFGYALANVSARRLAPARLLLHSSEAAPATQEPNHASQQPIF